MTDDVLCIRVSADSRYLAVSLLDASIKVFYADTLRFCLSLYGHQLPALCMDISSDSTLCVTGSADKTVRIWGMDFGDCHRSLLAHVDSVMGVQFVQDSHMFFTVYFSSSSLLSGALYPQYLFMRRPPRMAQSRTGTPMFSSECLQSAPTMAKYGVCQFRRPVISLSLVALIVHFE